MIKSEILNLELDFYDIIGIDESAENDLEDMELYLQDGEIDLEKLKSGEEMILNFSMYADMYDIKVGDILKITGTVERRYDTFQLIAEKAIKL